MAVTTKYDRKFLTTTNETAVWQAGPNGGVLTNLIICNTTASAVTITITINDSGTGKIPLLSGVSVAANSTISFDMKQALGASKYVYATASTGNSALAVHASGVDL